MNARARCAPPSPRPVIGDRVAFQRRNIPEWAKGPFPPVGERGRVIGTYDKDYFVVRWDSYVHPTDPAYWHRDGLQLLEGDVAPDRVGEPKNGTPAEESKMSDETKTQPSKAEIAIRQLLARLTGVALSQTGAMDRQLIVTVERAAYGEPSAVLLALEGSPPKARLLVLLEGENVVHNLVAADYYHTQPFTSGQRQKHMSVLQDYLLEIGVLRPT